MRAGNSRSRGLAALAIAALLVAACARSVSPDEVALEYGRALYASDAEAIWRLLSRTDRRVKDVDSFRRQLEQTDGFAREVVRQLAGYVTATSVNTVVRADRATVTLRFRLPDANAPDLRALAHDWDEQRLNALTRSERDAIRARLERLHREGSLPIVEGDETIRLVREESGWRVFLDWASRGVRVDFTASVGPGQPLEVTVTPASAVVAPGGRVRVTLRARNTGRREVTTRVGHRIEPEAHATSLALLVCPLLTPVIVAPGEAREFVSEYMLLPDVPAAAKAFTVAYRFPAMPTGRGRGRSPSSPRCSSASSRSTRAALA